jgi:hypothetical protein
MTCERCSGLMVSERIYDQRGMSSDFCVDGYRCLLCGNLVDAIILENKQRVYQHGRVRNVELSSTATVCGSVR